MSVSRTYHCDADGCEVHATTAANRMAMSFLRVTGDGRARHFCSWDCLMMFAASMEPAEVIRADEPPEGAR